MRINRILQRLPDARMKAHSLEEKQGVGTAPAVWSAQSRFCSRKPIGWSEI